MRVALPPTMTGRGTPSRFLASVLRNGVGRYVCQLQRITLTVSQHLSNSLGARWGEERRCSSRAAGPVSLQASERSGLAVQVLKQEVSNLGNF